MFLLVRRSALVLSSVVAGLALAAACASQKEGAAGAPCDRASECAPGLVCIDRVCSGDLNKLDGGNVPVFDMGSEAVAADGDEAGEVDPDAPPPPDTGTPIDTGTPPDTKPPPDTAPPPDTFMPDTFMPDTAVEDTASSD